MNKSGIYIIANTRNNKFYIGSAEDFEARKKSHFADLHGGYHHCDHLQNAYNKEANKSVFVFEPIFFCAQDKATLTENEQVFLDLSRDAKAQGVLYNSSMLAARPEMTLEVRAKISASNKGKMPWCKGKKLSAEHCAKIGAIRKGIPSPRIRGSANCNAKLTDADVFYIRSVTERPADLAEKFGICVKNIYDIRHLHTWKHVENPAATTVRHGNAKLTDADVLYIHKSTESLRKLSLKLNISASVIQDIRKGYTWKHLL